MQTGDGTSNTYFEPSHVHFAKHTETVNMSKQSWLLISFHFKWRGREVIINYDKLNIQKNSFETFATTTTIIKFQEFLKIHVVFNIQKFLWHLQKSILAHIKNIIESQI